MTEENKKKDFIYVSLSEKYRPNTWSDLIGINPQYIENIRFNIENNEPVKFILIYGPPGTGKTTLAQIIASSTNCLNREKGSSEPCGYCDVCLGISEDNITSITIGKASDKLILETLISKSQSPPMILENEKGEIINKEQRVINIINEVQKLSGNAIQQLLEAFEPPPHRNFNSLWILTTMDLESIGSITAEALRRRAQDYELGFHSSKEIKKRMISIFPQMDIKAIDAFSSLTNKTMGEAWSKFNLIHPRITIEDITEDIIYEVLGGGCTPSERIKLYACLYKKSTESRHLIETWKSKGLKEETLTNFILEDLSIYTLYIKDDKEQKEVLSLTRDIYSCIQEGISIEVALIANSNKNVFKVLGKCNKEDKNIEVCNKEEIEKDKIKEEVNRGIEYKYRDNIVERLLGNSLDED